MTKLGTILVNCGEKLAARGAPELLSSVPYLGKMALCAAAMLPCGNHDPHPLTLAAADLQCDGPSASAVWLCGMHHKTGTELNAHLMGRLPAGCYDHTRDGNDNGHPELQGKPRCATVQRCENYDEPRCVAIAGGGGIAFAESISITSVDKWQAVRTAATFSAGSPQLRAVHWVRDPTEVIMSGLFYHKVTDEAWVRAAPSRTVDKWFAACGQYHGEGHRRAPQDVCTAVYKLGSAARLGSYHDLLNALPDEEGVLVEAWRTAHGHYFGEIHRGELAEMNATMHVLAAFPEEAITVDLSEAEAECEGVFGLVFEASRAALSTPTRGGKDCTHPCRAARPAQPASGQTRPYPRRAGARELTHGQ